MKHKVLMYHAVGISNNGEIGAGLYSVPVMNFEQQMEYVAPDIKGQSPKRDIRVQHFGDSPFNAGDSPLITFDDGDITNYKHAFPILQLLGLKAYFFIIVSKVGLPGYMTWHQIRELKSAGMTMGSHGMTHKILTTLKPQELKYEIKESKKILEEKLHGKIEYFSIPRGFYNKKIIHMAKEAGYKCVFTSDLSSTAYKIGRIPVKANWSLEHFKKVINNGVPLREHAKELLKNSTKKILGARGYDKVRSALLK